MVAQSRQVRSIGYSSDSDFDEVDVGFLLPPLFTDLPLPYDYHEDPANSYLPRLPTWDGRADCLILLITGHHPDIFVPWLSTNDLMVLHHQQTWLAYITARRARQAGHPGRVGAPRLPARLANRGPPHLPRPRYFPLVPQLLAPLPLAHRGGAHPASVTPAEPVLLLHVDLPPLLYQLSSDVHFSLFNDNSASRIVQRVCRVAGLALHVRVLLHLPDLLHLLHRLSPRHDFLPFLNLLLRARGDAAAWPAGAVAAPPHARAEPLDHAPHPVRTVRCVLGPILVYYDDIQVSTLTLDLSFGDAVSLWSSDDLYQ